MRIQSIIAAALLAIAALAIPATAGATEIVTENDAPIPSKTADAPAPPPADVQLTAADYCGPQGSWIGTVVPDRWGAADFGPGCYAHDECYSSDSATDRYNCDDALRSNLARACYDAYGEWAAVNGCMSAVGAYYLAVRNFGEGQYEGSGDPD